MNPSFRSPLSLLKFVRSTVPDDSEPAKRIDAFSGAYIWGGVIFMGIAIVVGSVFSILNSLPERDRPVAILMIQIFLGGCAIALAIVAVKAMIRSRKRHLAYEAMLREEREAEPTERR
jgi:hypothetical protein